MNRKRFGRRRSIHALLLVVAGLAVLMLGPGAMSASAAVTVTNDVQGANDEPGQKDLTRFTIDSSAAPGTLVVSFNHDETGFTGSNTGDGCLLFDTDGDGNANYALCTTFGGDPSTLQSTSLYSCGDDRSDRCSQPATAIASFNSTCSVAVTATDPFPTGADNPNDTTSSCTVSLADFGDPTTATLLDACSYPSQQPNSDPSDCIIASTGPVAAARLRSVTARLSARTLNVRWQTASEIDVAGYNVFGVVNGHRTRLNARIIASKGSNGHRYSFTYRLPHGMRAPSRILLQVVNLDGSRQWSSARVAS
jgi:hypothetical protein